MHPPYPQHDGYGYGYGYGYEAWAAAPYDTNTYDAWGYEEWTDRACPALVDGEPSLRSPNEMIFEVVGSLRER
ncbi:hypothetical protein ABZY81_29330 [Streptomyces sp. NPDC006514]|uniref:hypothetical protein n=1 Tax=Streptomyces sp. NPDC006514 TaxID=3154308 RepID=UPI0033B04B79